MQVDAPTEVGSPIWNKAATAYWQAGLPLDDRRRLRPLRRW
jgi:hypothetical protein